MDELGQLWAETSNLAERDTPNCNARLPLLGNHHNNNAQAQEMGTHFATEGLVSETQDN